MKSRRTVIKLGIRLSRRRSVARASFRGGGRSGKVLYNGVSIATFGACCSCHGEDHAIFLVQRTKEFSDCPISQHLFAAFPLNIGVIFIIVKVCSTKDRPSPCLMDCMVVAVPRRPQSVLDWGWHQAAKRHQFISCNTNTVGEHSKEAATRPGYQR